ncbi:MAG TPA: CoA pyrophosphatase [Steroidobacteraceae bacterium]|nr:CoA pyrophosphatase [Steroidobacteraceae bacterium]
MSAAADAATAPAALRARLRARLAGTRPSGPGEGTLAGLPREISDRYRHLLPAALTKAAVLVPILDHADGLTVLLTERAPDLRHHPGQISFPGGRLETSDAGPLEAALRETEEEIGLPRGGIEVLGFLPDHLIVTGYSITPVVALVAPGRPLRLDPVEVASVFEVPLAFLLDPANHRLRRRPVGDGFIELYDIPFGQRNIWGATAGMLLTLCRLLAPPPAAETPA